MMRVRVCMVFVFTLDTELLATIALNLEVLFILV